VLVVRTLQVFPSREYSSLTLATRLALQVMLWLLPISQRSPPLGELTVTLPLSPGMRKSLMTAMCCMLVAIHEHMVIRLAAAQVGVGVAVLVHELPPRAGVEVSSHGEVVARGDVRLDVLHQAGALIVAAGAARAEQVHAHHPEILRAWDVDARPGEVVVGDVGVRPLTRGEDGIAADDPIRDLRSGLPVIEAFAYLLRRHSRAADASAVPLAQASLSPEFGRHERSSPL
jgi:hypothetical protein